MTARQIVKKIGKLVDERTGTRSYMWPAMKHDCVLAFVVDLNTTKTRASSIVTRLTLTIAEAIPSEQNRVRISTYSDFSKEGSFSSKKKRGEISFFRILFEVLRKPKIKRITEKT